jgi:hypothetical protein
VWNQRELPPTLLACHHCDNPPCCNPLHIFAGTHADNHKDRDRKGRGGWQRPGFAPPKIRGEAHPRAKLTAQKVQEIRLLYQQGVSSPTLAALYGVAKYNILAIIHRRNWKHVP